MCCLQSMNIYLFKRNNVYFRLPFDRGSLDRNSLDQNCVFSVAQKFHNQLIKFFYTFHLIKNSINCQKRTYGCWQLIETLIMSFWVILNFWSSDNFLGVWSNSLFKLSIKWKVSKNSIKWLVKFWSTEKWQFRSSEIRSSDCLPILNFKRLYDFFFNYINEHVLSNIIKKIIIMNTNIG